MEPVASTSSHTFHTPPPPVKDVEMTEAGNDSDLTDIDSSEAGEFRATASEMRDGVGGQTSEEEWDDNVSNLEEDFEPDYPQMIIHLTDMVTSLSLENASLQEDKTALESKVAEYKTQFAR